MEGGDGGGGGCMGTGGTERTGGTEGLTEGWMVGGCVRPSGLWDLVLSALRIVESGFVCPSGVGVDDGGWLCPPFGIVGSGFVRPSDCGIWFCPPFGIVGSGFVRPSGLMIITGGVGF